MSRHWNTWYANTAIALGTFAYVGRKDHFGPGYTVSVQRGPLVAKQNVITCKRCKQLHSAHAPHTEVVSSEEEIARNAAEKYDWQHTSIWRIMVPRRQEHTMPGNTEMYNGLLEELARAEQLLRKK